MSDERKVYSVGDKVTVKSTLQENRWYDGCYVVDDMFSFAGKECTITGINSRYTNRYYLKEDFKRWSWTSDMFEKNSIHEDKD